MQPSTRAGGSAAGNTNTAPQPAQHDADPPSRQMLRHMEQIAAGFPSVSRNHRIMAKVAAVPGAIGLAHWLSGNYRAAVPWIGACIGITAVTLFSMAFYPPNIFVQLDRHQD